MPEKLISRLKNNILPEWKTCFWSAIIIGLIAHLYKITNWLPNWDSLVFRHDTQNMIGMGRWFLPVAAAPSSFYDLPWITGLMSIVFYTLGAICICKIFNVRKNITAMLIGAAVVSFPTVTSTMQYNYVADAYALSFLFACIAALLMTDKKPKYIAATVFIALSVGTYQAYITVTIMLLLCYLIIEVLKKGVAVKDILLKSVKFLLTGAAGMALYYLILMLLLKITSAELLDYQGFGDAVALSNLNIMSSLYNIKESFIAYFFDFSNGLNIFIVINATIFALTVVLYLIGAVKNKLKLSQILIACIGVVLLPIGASVLAFVNKDVDYHTLMKMGFFVFYLFFILQYETEGNDSNKLGVIKSWTIFVISALLIFNQIIIANVSYHKLTLSFEKSYGTLIRIADRIEQTAGTEECDSILALGALEGSEAYSAMVPLKLVGTTDGLIIRADDETVGQSVLCSALNDYCLKEYKFVAGEQKKELLKKVDLENMDNWPASNSICVVDNVIVIKLGDQR